MCLFELLPWDPSRSLPFHSFPMYTSVPPRELQTQMCSFPFCSIYLFAQSYLTYPFSKERGPRDPALFSSFKVGSAQGKALRRGQEQQCGHHPSLPNLKAYLQTFRAPSPSPDSQPVARFNSDTWYNPMCHASCTLC